MCKSRHKEYTATSGIYFGHQRNTAYLESKKLPLDYPAPPRLQSHPATAVNSLLEKLFQYSVETMSLTWYCLIGERNSQKGLELQGKQDRGVHKTGKYKHITYKYINHLRSVCVTMETKCMTILVILAWIYIWLAFGFAVTRSGFDLLLINY